MGDWAIGVERGDPRSFHARDLPDPVVRSIWWFEAESPALALGSTQSGADVDMTLAQALGVDVFHRHSGGGAVLLDPGEVLWCDVVVPLGDALWCDDVGVAAHWLGEVWRDALADCGLSGAEVHRGAMVAPPISRVVCFAGLGPGEVTVGGAKVVGISQRRTRSGARFQCAVPLGWRMDRHVELLGPGLARLGPDATSDDVAVHPFVESDEVTLREALLSRLSMC